MLFSTPASALYMYIATCIYINPLSHQFDTLARTPYYNQVYIRTYMYILHTSLCIYTRYMVIGVKVISVQSSVQRLHNTKHSLPYLVIPANHTLDSFHAHTVYTLYVLPPQSTHYTCTCIYMYLNLHIYTCTCICTCIYTYTHAS